MGLALDTDGSTPIEFWRAELARDGDRVLFEVRDTAAAAAKRLSTPIASRSH